MTITPDSVQQLLASADYGDRLKAVNHIRQLEPTEGFRLLQQAAQDGNSRVRYAAVSQFASLGHQDLAFSAAFLRDRLLTDTETDVQAAAADSLGALHVTDALDDLVQVYASTSEWLVKMSIVATLGELGNPRAFDLLQDALNSEVEVIQTAAIGALGELGDLRAVDIIIPLAASLDWQVRFRVAQALHRLGHPSARPALEILATDKSAPVAQTAAEALKAIAQ